MKLKSWDFCCVLFFSRSNKSINLSQIASTCYWWLSDCLKWEASHRATILANHRARLHYNLCFTRFGALAQLAEISVWLLFNIWWTEHTHAQNLSSGNLTWQQGVAAKMSYVYIVPSWCQLPSQRDLHLMQTILWTPSKQSTQMAYRCISLPVGVKVTVGNAYVRKLNCKRPCRNGEDTQLLDIIVRYIEYNLFNEKHVSAL